MNLFCRFEKDNKINYGIVKDNIVQSIEGNIFGDWKVGNESYLLGEVKLLPPVEPSKIVCVGLNYHSTIKRLNAAVPEEPVIFLKPPSAIIGDGDNIIFPSDVKELGYEVELAVIIKDKIKSVNYNEALKHVFGYTIANDLTAKDKMTGGPWTKAKSYDTFLPLGPWIATDLDPNNAKLEMYINGNMTQNGNTSDMVFDVAYLISYISKIMTLCPGDVIITGTPPGAGLLNPGDYVEAKIEGIGVLRNYVVKEC
ncbi:5-carboxymethyl-2-hydroxymuconate Delta-isomerase [Caldicellulosiruptor hydrothermalis 108]|uniref:5-carboxymethyl-2-hydroxymuconate Delta-isomerase n=1 Tax=Caldicellulosiruptor hydrothermalis (strain DSM 18901 / VKM B-2411 / 108) TaxID=632292 RepID=E4QCE7_CALH1|nr:fumarylacetoacetate hydrolase family protein [Caldicellulosiruptor hydrothermalis]ADQ06243.1 5-carboxymethyl-2-hydroxymuconate Delta-isomerase [Caldicellulosiruptor hydrothermalis 108]